MPSFQQFLQAQASFESQILAKVGVLRAQQLLPPTSRFRPEVPSGVSAGHFAITAGTLGAVVKDRMTGEKLLLSNNHVFANSNDAQLGDAILQPGPADGGQNPGDQVARLERFIPLTYVEDANQPLPNGGGTNPTRWRRLPTVWPHCWVAKSVSWQLRRHMRL
jgi:hypothetical protein